MPSPACYFCGVSVASKHSVTFAFIDGTSARDIPTDAIIRLAGEPQHRHAPYAPQGEGLHKACKAVLKKVKDAFAIEPKPPVRRSQAAAGTSDYAPQQPKSRKRGSDELQRAGELQAEAEEFVKRMRHGEISLVDGDALEALEQYDPETLVDVHQAQSQVLEAARGVLLETPSKQAAGGAGAATDHGGSTSAPTVERPVGKRKVAKQPSQFATHAKMGEADLRKGVWSS